MYERILVAVDGSAPADAALEHALDIAAARGATVHALNVTNTGQSGIGGDEAPRDELVRAGEEAVEDARERAAERGVDAVAEVLDGTPRATILEYAAANAVDLIVLGTHGRRGVKRMLLGSVAEQVVRDADAPALVVRTDGDATYPYDTVLAPIDGSDHAAAALEEAIAVAIRHDAALRVFSAVNVTLVGVDTDAGPVADQVQRNARELVERAEATVAEAGVDDVDGTVRTGPPHEAIDAYADEAGADLIVMGTHGRSGLDRYLLGSVTERTLRATSTPVLTVRGPDAGEE